MHTSLLTKMFINDNKKEIGSQFSTPNLLAETCEKPDSFTDEDYYGCNQIIRESITFSNQRLQIYHCTFSNFNSDVITINKYTESSSILIKSSSFFNCKKKSISLNSVESTDLTISYCSFSYCSTLGNSIIHFASNYGIIEQCYFCDNCVSGNAADIYYQPAQSQQQETEKLTITHCVFEHANSANPTNFVSFALNAKFDFKDNNIVIFDTSKIFKVPSGFTDFSGCSITGNTMIPFNTDLFGANLPDDFSIIDLPDSECSKLPDDVDASAGKNTELCGNEADNNPDSFVTSNTIVSIFYSSFVTIGNSETQGGAIYISIPEKLTTDKANPLQIYNSAFTDCSAKEGCAIYFESKEASRLLDIHRCIFDSNKNDAAKGGCIYIDAPLSFVKLAECLFTQNVANVGGCIYYTSYDDSETSSNENEFALYIEDCRFSHNAGYNCGGVIYISVKSAKSHKLIEINNCQFLFTECIHVETVGNIDEKGGAIYYESSSLTANPSTENNYNFRVVDSYFEKNHVSSYGGALYMSVSGNEPSNSIEISGCLFNENQVFTGIPDQDPRNLGYGGDIYYILDSSKTTQSTNTNSLLYVHDCYHLNSAAYSEGGSICIAVKDSESSRNIKIDRCSFNYNDNIDKDLYFFNKKGIFIAYTVVSTSSESQCNDNPSLQINDCNLSCLYNADYEDKLTEKGGLVYFSVSNSQQTGSIEINRCKFICNIPNTKTDLIGGSIYYTYESTSATTKSKSLLESTPVLKINDCEFPKSFSKLYGGSLYFTVIGGENKVFEINHCMFEKSKSEKNNDCIYLKSDSKSVSFNFNDCDFVDSSIFFDALSATIEDCRFTEYDTGKNAIRYLSKYEEATTECSFTINNCSFMQKEKELSLIYFETELCSVFKFTNNVINFSSTNSHVFDINNTAASVKGKEYWSFDQNAIEPAEYSVIKTEAADDIPASCGTEFLCPGDEDSSSSSSTEEELPPVEPTSEEQPTTPDEPFDGECTPKPDDFTKNDFYACKLIIKGKVLSKGSLLIDQCNFTNFKDTPVSINEYTGESERSINIKRCNFVSCAKGAISITNTEAKELTISQCYFIFCTSENGMNVIQFTSKRGIIEKCKFYYNYIKKDANGVIYYENPSSEPDDKLIIRKCFFEHGGYDRSYFLCFASDSKFEFTNNVFKIYESETRVFLCANGNADLHEYKIRGNTLQPFVSDLIGSDITIPEKAFSIPPESECPGLPAGVEKTENNYQCGNIAEDITENTLIESQTIVSIYYSSFSYCGNTESNGGALYISLPADLQVDITIPVKIYYTLFSDNTAKYGCGIYLESPQNSLLFDIHQCTFINNFNQNCFGAGVYIKSSSSTFKLSRCLFKDNIALNGAGIYYTTGESNSLLLDDSYEEETKFALNVKDCIFQGNSVYNNGCAICINANEILKPIEINSCIFLKNSNKEEDEEVERGGAIYYSYNSQTSINTPEMNYVFRAFNSIFEENSVNNYGGAIYTSIASKEPSHPIEIDICSFGVNQAEIGGSIYYVFEPSSASTSDETSNDNNYCFNVIHCTFAGDTATENGGSIYMIMKNGEPSKTVLIDDCTFASSKSKNGCSIYYEYPGTSSESNNNNNKVLFINKCTFSYDTNSNSLSDIENGGSIYISTKNSEFSRQIEINGSSFKHSKAQNGGSIYYTLESSTTATSQSNYLNLLKISHSKFVSSDGLLGCAIHLRSFEPYRLFEIIQCIFDHNSESNTKENSLCGGGIYINSIHSSFKLTNCLFDQNNANEGAAVYYTSSESTKSLLLLEEEEETEDKNDLALYFDDCEFKSNTALDNGGAISISIKNLKSPKPIEINNCRFNRNTAVEPEYQSAVDYLEYGGAVYYSYESDSAPSADENGCIFRVVDSQFTKNEVTGYGGSLYILVLHNEPSKLVEIGGCTFIENHAQINNYNVEKAGYGGDVCYALDQVAKSQLTKSLLHIYDCNALNSNGYTQGGSLFISIQDSESSRPIEIERCSFKSNKDFDPDFSYQVLNGNFISYSVDSKGNSPSKDNSPLLINDCNFSCTSDLNDEFYDKLTEKGGSIHLTVKNSQQTGCIEISNCNFTSNFMSSKESLGGSIYYSYESTIVSTNSNELLELTSVLKITNCEFSESYSKLNGGSIYLTITGAENKQVDINHCSFVKSNSVDNKDSVYIKSDSKTVTFKIIDCDFVSNSLFFNALSASVDSCRFDDIEKNCSAIKYLSQYIVGDDEKPSKDCQLSVNKCNFTQKTNEVSLVFFETELSSMFSFTDNIIKFPENSFVLDSRSQIKHKEADYWYFDNNAIEPAESVVIKNETAIDIPASCGTQFLCLVPSTSEAESTSSDESSADSSPIESLPIESSPSEEPPSDGNCVGNNPCIKEGGDGSEIVILEDRDYRDFNGTRHGAAVRLINYGFQCIRCNFTSCTVTEGGGGIYIVLQKEVSLPILLQNLTFVRCQAIYGGAVYIYSDLEQNEVKIVSCVFEDNTASRVPDSNLENHLFGGAAVYLQVSNSNITNCAFRKNHGSGLKPPDSLHFPRFLSQLLLAVFFQSDIEIIIIN